MRAAVEHGKELTADIEDADRSAAQFDYLALARWNLLNRPDDVLQTDRLATFTRHCHHLFATPTGSL
jgi:hypothetical protein